MLWNTQSCLFLGKELISCKLIEWCVWLFHTCRTRKRVPLSSPGHPATKHALHMANLFVIKRTQTQTASPLMLSCKSKHPQKFKLLVDGHSTKTDSFDWNSLLYRLEYRCQKGLSGVYPYKSAANICKLRQWRSQQPSCLDYIVLDDRLSVIDCNIICECSVTATREGSPLVQLKQPATQILTALLLQQKRWDRPLGTVHFATAKCQLIQLFATIQVTKNRLGLTKFQFQLLLGNFSFGSHA